MNSKFTPEKQQAFLAVLSETGLIGRACEAISITRQTAYNWRETYPEFKEAWIKAERIAASVLDDEVTRRALEGYQEKTYIDGVLFKVVEKYSDKLLLAAARAHNPDKYCSAPKLPEGPPILNVITGVPDPISKLTKDEMLDRLEELHQIALARKRAAESAESSDPDVDELC